MTVVAVLRSCSIISGAALLAAAVALPQPAFAAPDNTSGMAIMAAKVSSGGLLDHGFGAKAVTRHSAGSYTVTFDRFVSQCYYYVTASSDDSNLPPVVIDVQDGDGSVDVRTFTVANNPTDMGFYLLVFCGK